MTDSGGEVSGPDSPVQIPGTAPEDSLAGESQGETIGVPAESAEPSSPELIPAEAEVLHESALSGPIANDRGPIDKPRRGGRTQDPDEKLKVARRVQAMIDLRVQGYIWPQIAAFFGYSDERSARRAIDRYLKNTPAPQAAELRALENARYDKVNEKLWPGVLQGDDRKIELFIRLSARRCALNGLDLQPKFMLGPGPNGDEPGRDHADDAARDQWRLDFAKLSVQAKQEIAAVIAKHLGPKDPEAEPGP